MSRSTFLSKGRSGVVIAFIVLTWWIVCPARDDYFGSVVILRVTFAGEKGAELGTGFFVDHDGLIVTADHVLHKYSVSPEKPPFYPGAGQRATQIEVFNRNLPGGKVTVSPGQGGIEIVSGNFERNKWMDMAMFRIPVDNATRRKIQPLDTSTQGLTPTSRLVAYGPNCTSPNNNDCLTPLASTFVTVQNEIIGAYEYVVSAQITPGYSGGPLINLETGKVIGVCSRIKIEGPYGPTRVFYVPLHYLVALATPRSTFFEATRACSNVESLEVLTEYDWIQVRATFPADQLNQTQCNCCCMSLKKAPTSALRDALPYKSCQPPWCEIQVLNSLIRAVDSELAKAEPDLDQVKSIYVNAGALYRDIVGSKATSTESTRAEAYKVFGDFLAGIASNPRTASSPFFFDAGIYALRAYSNAQKLNESAETYSTMSRLAEKFAFDDFAYKANVLKECKTASGQANNQLCSSVKSTKRELLNFAAEAPKMIGKDGMIKYH
jgi:trypsin-like peptidase